jgi:sigma-B regulation protein RsbU (phosphoserine phosphatase)
MLMPVLLVIPKNGETSTLTLTGRNITIGRIPGNDIILSDSFSSSSHAVVSPLGDGYNLRDLGSKNGTFLNGERISGEVKLQLGDEIRIGSTRIVYSRESGSEIHMVEDAVFGSGSSTAIKVGDILKDSLVAPSLAGQADGLGLEDFHRHQKFSSILIEVSQALIYQMELNKLLDYTMDLITRVIPMDRGILMLKEGKTEELVPKVIRVHGTSAPTQHVIVSKSILKTAFQKNSAVLISDVHADKSLSGQESIMVGQTYSAMCVPLWNNREIMGLIYSDREFIHGQFTEEDLRLLTVLANLAALKIENTRLFEESLEKARIEQELILAEKIQQSLMPQRNPNFEPYDIAGCMWPCRHIGGDYFDFIPLDPSSLGIVIADVSGHGIGAAFLMASLRASLYALIPTTRDLRLLAAKLNDIVHADSDDHTFISFFWGVLNRETAEITYVNAGHNPPLLVNSARAVQFLDNTGPCLGMLPSVSYEMKTIPFERDSLLCLHTDGIIESRNQEGEEFGEERLYSQLCISLEFRAQTILEAIYAGVRRFDASDELSDDVTLVIVKGSPPGSPTSSRPSPAQD